MPPNAAAADVRRPRSIIPMLASLLAYWQGKRGDRPLPARRDIDPLEMGPNLLPHLLLCDLFDRGARVRFRLVGTIVVKRLGFDPTGDISRRVMTGGYGDLMAALHRLVYCERAPVYGESLFTWGADRRLTARHLLLPLTQDGPDPAIALAGLVFAFGRTVSPDDPHARLGQPPRDAPRSPQDSRHQLLGREQRPHRRLSRVIWRNRTAPSPSRQRGSGAPARRLSLGSRFAWCASDLDLTAQLDDAVRWGCGNTRWRSASCGA